MHLKKNQRVLKEKIKTGYVRYLQVNALIARELSGFTCTSSLTMNEKFQYLTRRPRAVLKI